MVDLCEKCGHRAVCRFREHYEECLQFIEDVVRCRDCKHYKPQFQGAHRNCKTPYCMRCTAVKVSPDDFCSYGERREEE